MAMDFKELYMSFTQDSQTHTLNGLQAGSPKIINSHRMDKLLKKGHSGIIAQFNTIQGDKYPHPTVHSNLQKVLEKHQQVFGMPKGLPPS